jgi:hypothetical protein
MCSVFLSEEEVSEAKNVSGVREALEPAVAALIRQILRYELNHNFTEYLYYWF